MSAKKKIAITCRSCDQERALDDYRLFKTEPRMYMDFCVECEKRWSTITLYRRYTAYATEEISRAVFAAERLPEGKRTPEQVRLLVEQQRRAEPATNEEVIRQEIARRELARRRLLFFVSAFHPDYKAGWVHQDLCRRLERFMEAVERGESPRLMIFMPPRAGKSEIASGMFPSWVLGHHPEWEMIIASYGLDLPVGWSRQIRDRIRDPEYKAIFDKVHLRTDSQAIESWKTSKNGGLTCAGIGVGITGKGMHIGIVDDPIKDYEAAQSEVIREATYAWYTSVFRTRLAPGGGIIVIQTRWHDADLSGKLLSREEELRKAGVPASELENWDVISYSAIAEHDEVLLTDGTIGLDVPDDDPSVRRVLRRKGEALHPERWPLIELKKIKNSQTPSEWASMYQQNPVPDDGDFFKKSDFSYRVLPREYWPKGRIITTWDFAITEKKRNNHTVGVVGILTASDDLYVVDVRRGRWQSLELVSQIVDVIRTYKPEIFAGERGQIYAAIWPMVLAELDKHRLYVNFDESLVPIQDKEARARPLQNRMQRHRLHFSYEDSVRPAMYDDVERELLRFPTGTSDDIVDALAWLARLAMNVSLPVDIPHTSKLKSWKDKLVIPGTATSPMSG